MRQKARKNKKAIKRLWIIILLVLFLTILIILFSKFFWIRKPLFISPVTTNSRKQTEGLERLFSNVKIEFLSISLNSDTSYSIELQDRSKIILSSKKDIQRQISSLQPILKLLTIEGRRFEVLDFRFDKPVIKY